VYPYQVPHQQRELRAEFEVLHATEFVVVIEADVIDAEAVEDLVNVM
jgi:hypothetical protein